MSEFVAYVADDDPRERHPDGTPILSLEQLADLEDTAVFVPIHAPAGRRSVFDRITAAGVPILGSSGLPHLSDPSAELGEGVIITSTTRIGFATALGRGTIVMGDLVAHDVTIGDFCTLAAHSKVLGHVNIGHDVFVGAGAIIKNGTPRRPLLIGDGAVIGIGAVVDRDVAPGETVISPRAVSIAEWQAMRAAAKRPGADAS